VDAGPPRRPPRPQHLLTGRRPEPTDEAVDWYNQRAHATEDTELAAILEHHRDEEKEHTVMLLEWLRRRDPALDRHLKTYLFTEGSITDIEHAAEAD
jgi:uncharacterized protein